MANKYTKIPNPPKTDLESLYHDNRKSQTEIAEIYDVSQKVVFRWFRELGIKSRIPAKRNQRGQNNDSWRGEEATYSALHYRVIALKGRPKKCEVCGTTDETKRYDWACVGDYYNVNDYQRMCRSCHWKHDKIANNFPNHGQPKSNSSKHVRTSAK